MPNLFRKACPSASLNRCSTHCRLQADLPPSRGRLFALPRSSSKENLAEAAEVVGALNYIPSREKAPWDERHRPKSCGTAYRWSVGLPVTPPLMALDKSRIHIAGGMHRFHLAVACGARAIPFLVEPAALAAILALLPSARAI